MSIIKRLSTTLVSSIDHMVADIENHDAVIQASLTDMHKKIATARIRLNQLQQEEQQLQRQIKILQDNAQKWRTRAVETSKTDEAKAMACLNQRQQCMQQSEQLAQESLQYQQAIQTLARDISSSEQQMNAMSHKHRLLRARQSSAEAMQSPQRNSALQDNLNDTFERWEVRIAQGSSTLHQTPLVDPLEHEFATAEHEIALKAELAALLIEEKHHAN